MDKIKEFIGTKKVAVAVSGGADSMYLLHAASLEAKEITAIHVNHQTRPESLEEQRFVENFCRQRNIPCIVKMPSVPISHSNFEHEARKVRYKLFEEAVAECGAEVLLMAHHQDDQIENIFLRLVRGSRNFELPIERPLNENVFIIRPFLSYNKSELLDMLKQSNIPYIEDPSNHRSDYLRNFFRLNILPKLYEKIPHFREIMHGVVISSQEEHDFLENIVETSVDELFQNRNFCDQDCFLSKHIYLQKKILKYQCRNFFNITVSNEKLKEMCRIAAQKSPASKVLLESVEGTLLLESHSLKFILKKEKKTLANSSNIIHNKNSLSELYQIKIIEGDGLRWEGNIPENACQISDFSGLSLRTPIPGDKVPWYGGMKKISQILKDRKVPRSERDFVYLITHHDLIVGIITPKGIDIFQPYRAESDQIGLFFIKNNSNIK